MRYLTLLLIAASAPALSQTFPAKPVRMVVAAAGGAEIVARLVAQNASGPLGQPVVVDVQAGAAGVIGSGIVAKAVPDGHTVLLATVGSQLIRLFVAKSTPYNPSRDFAPITQAAETVNVIAATASLPVNSLRDLVDYAKRNPGKISYGSSGVGTGQHLAFEMLKHLTGMDVVHVPYKSGAQSVTALVAGEIALSAGILASTTPHLKSGKVKLIALIRDRRYDAVPDVPTVTETVPDFAPVPAWMGYFGPAGLPREVLSRLNVELARALNLPEVRAKAGAIGFVVNTNTPEQFADQIRRDTAVMERIVKALKFQPSE